MKIQFDSYKFTPILGWSSSRYELFNRCKRAYFYNYYGKFDKAHSFQKIKELKSMTSVPMEVGNVIHHIIETFLGRLQKSNKPLDEQKFLDYGINLVDTLFAKKTFLETYYGYTQEIDHNFAKVKVEAALKNFLRSPLYNWICSTPLESRKEWVIEPAGFGETRIDGLKAYCKMDFLLPVDGKIHILDWKSGKKSEEKHSAQLLGYSLAAQASNPNLLASDIVPKIVYMLPDIEEFQVDITTDKLASFKNRVKSETTEMQKFCVDVDNNTPVGIEKFEKCGNDNICRLCFFQEFCR